MSPKQFAEILILVLSRAVHIAYRENTYIEDECQVLLPGAPGAPYYMVTQLSVQTMQ